MSKNLAARHRIFTRDNFTCQYCGAKPPDVVLEVDHIIPKSHGGKTRLDNLITACFACNRGKRDILLSSDHLEHFKAKTRVIRRQTLPKDIDALCVNCDQVINYEWPCPHCGSRLGSYPDGLQHHQLSESDQKAYVEWAEISRRNKERGRCQCIRPAEVMGTMCDACLFDLADRAEARRTRKVRR